MSGNKSLGSSPIGHTGRRNETFGFIPDLGVSSGNRSERKSESAATDADTEKKEAEKKVVSYYLEVELVKRVKNIADERGLYYSTIVSKALSNWIDREN